MIWVVIILAIIGLDQFTKYLVMNNIAFGEKIPVIDGFFYLAHWKNTGAAWGILEGWRFFLIPVTIIVSVILAHYLVKSDNKIFKLSLSMILGGAIGNLIDRAFRNGGVVDFLDFHFWSYNFPTFNVADCFIVIGTLCLSYYILFVMKDEKNIENNEL
ncbi:MAG TPA: signal peptidase II [Acetivibrio clariflavus]|nr:signal peptidase II [Acetivibrio clariflavus]